MRVVNYSEFRKKFAKNLDAVNDDKEIVIVSRPHGKNVVVMDMDEYNSIQETFYLSATEANRKRLENSIIEMSQGKGFIHNLLEG